MKPSTSKERVQSDGRRGSSGDFNSAVLRVDSADSVLVSSESPEPPLGVSVDEASRNSKRRRVDHAALEAASLPRPNTITRRPRFDIVGAVPAGVPQLRDEIHPYVPVPADGMCLYYCAIAGRDLAQWLSQTNEEGVGLTEELRAEHRSRARRLRASMIDLAIASGNVEQGNRLTLEGIGGYPGSDEIPLLAQCISGSVVVSCNDMHVHYGDGPVVLHLGYVASVDGSGHASPHFVVHQSYMASNALLARPSPSAEAASMDSSRQNVPVCWNVTSGVNFDMLPDRFRDVVFRMSEHISEYEVSKLHALDVFSGTGNMAAAFNAFRMPAATFDKEVGGESEDILGDAGLGQLLFNVARVVTGGVVWFGPPCSTWIWLSRRSTKRTRAEVGGDTSVAAVMEANEIAHIVADVIRTCHTLGLYYVLEQPASSLLFNYEPISAVLADTRAQSVSVELGRAGAMTPKPLRLMGTAPYLIRLAGIVRRRSMVTRARALTRREGGWVNGERGALRLSSSYPRTFCCIVARLHADLAGVDIPEPEEPTLVPIEVESD